MKILFKCYKILNSFTIFFFYEVIEKNYAIFENVLKSSVDVYEIMDAHFNYLGGIIAVMNTQIAKDFEKIHINIAKIYLKVNY
jgi:hypothetical protein